MVDLVRKRQGGFTMVELLMAMAVFSTVLTLCLAVFIQINRLYYRGLSVTRTQSASRELMNELSTKLQIETFSPPAMNLPDVPGPVGGTTLKQGYYCIGDVVYYYKLGVRSSDVSPAVASNPALGKKHVLARWVEPGFCTGSGPANPTAFSVSDKAVDLVDTNTSVYHFALTPRTISITLAYGDRALIDPATSNPAVDRGDSPNVRCAGGVKVTFCGVSKLETEVVNRTK